MADLRVLGATSNLIRLVLKSATTGQGKQGVSSATSGLVVSTIADNEATATAYSGSNLEAVTTLGTYAAPTSGKCRIKKVDDSAHPGLVEIQLADARFAVTGARRLVISVNDGQSTLLDADYEVGLTGPLYAPRVQLADGVAHGGTTATLRLGGSTSTPALYVTSSGGTAFQCESTGGAGNGGKFVGPADGNGLVCACGPNETIGNTDGNGLLCIASDTPDSGGTGRGGRGANFAGGAGGTGLMLQSSCTSDLDGSRGGLGLWVSAFGHDATGVVVQGTSLTPGDGARGVYVLGDNDSAVHLQTIGSGDTLLLAPTGGHGVSIQANGTDKHGLLVTGGTGGTCDGAKFVAGTGGVDVRGNVTGDVTGNLSGTVGGLTAAGLATLFTVDSTKVYADAVTGSPVKEIAAHAAATDVSALALQSTALAIKAQTDLLPSDPADESLVIAATDAIYARLGAPAGASLAADVAGVLTRVLTESYASDGATFTAAQALYMIWSLLAERNVSGTTVTCKKLDGSTSSLVLTLNSATQPTAQTRSG